VDLVVNVRNLTKRYGNIAALNNVTFEVNQGEVFGFLGPNGAGKTTTIRLLTGQTKPTSGVASVAGSTDALKLFEVPDGFSFRNFHNPGGLAFPIAGSCSFPASHILC